ncbi:MAG: cupin domain-containing protein [Planctomycetota bacterium]|nr:cupin domain-containing protein [Planctomycetota bacterium]
MKKTLNVQDLKPDEDDRSLRGNVKDRKSEILRDTYFLVDPDSGPSQRLKMGHTTIYPTGKTTGHAHDDMEEVYFVVSGKGIMGIGSDEFPIEAGDAFYVPPGQHHVTYQRGNIPLTIVWVTCRITDGGGEA